MKTMSKAFFGAFVLAAVSGVTMSQASAAIVCSDDECWHARQAYEYPSEAHVIVHDDNWTWGAGDHFRWREHEGRGYWHGDDWRDF